jgi:D-glycero-alpha-D-manno-heptose-7-phosphate kinase
VTAELVVGRRVVATAPVRVADVGGWTDTWFGSPGRVCHVAVGPGVEVDARLVEHPGPAPGAGAVHLVAPDIGVDQVVGPGGHPEAPSWTTPAPGRHPLLEHAVASVVGPAALPVDLGIEVRISSQVPPGASLGTSAAVLVALIGALDALIAGEQRFPEELAVLAHQVETQRAGREAGVQDQWAAAMGGVGLLAIGPYPEVRHESIAVPARAAAELDDRLVTVVFGPHDSSSVHAEVINAMVGCGGAEHDRSRQALRRLSALAGDAAAALADGALDGWGEVMVASTEAQRELHAGLVGPAHQAAIDVARSHGAVGWKVNGAGGDGGSLTILAGTSGAAGLAEALAREPAWQVVDVQLAPDGLRTR